MIQLSTSKTWATPSASGWPTSTSDIRGTRFVELDFVPPPRLERPEIVKMDYGMTDCSNYMLLRWSVDCSPDHRPEEERYRLWLSDPLTLHGVENAKLAPGYRPPVGASKE